MSDAQGFRYEEGTQRLIQQVYARGTQRHFHVGALQLLVAGLAAEGGMVMVQPQPNGNPVVSAWIPEGLAFRQASVLKRCRTWLANEEPLGFGDGPGFGFSPRCALSMRAVHRGAGASLWLVGRTVPFAARELRRARVLSTHLGYAGELALTNQAPPAPIAVGYNNSTVAETLNEMSTEEVCAMLDGMPSEVADCARWAARGYTNAQVAANLNVSEATVARRLNRVYLELGITGRHELPIKSILAMGKPERRVLE